MNIPRDASNAPAQFEEANDKANRENDGEQDENGAEHGEKQKKRYHNQFPFMLESLKRGTSTVLFGSINGSIVGLGWK